MTSFRPQFPSSCQQSRDVVSLLILWKSLAYRKSALEILWSYNSALTQCWNMAIAELHINCSLLCEMRNYCSNILLSPFGNTNVGLSKLVGVSLNSIIYLLLRPEASVISHIEPTCQQLLLVRLYHHEFVWIVAIHRTYSLVIMLSQNQPSAEFRL